DAGRVGRGQGVAVQLRAPAGRPRVRVRAAEGTANEMAITVLVIDDEAPIRLLCRVNLAAEGMEVLEAADGATGLARAREQVPGLDGWHVAEELLGGDRTRSIPIIFLTARAEMRDRARGLDLGGLDYVTKPFNPLELAPLVRELLDRVGRGERDELRTEKLRAL